MWISAAVRDDSELKRAGADPPRDTNPAEEEEEVAAGDVTAKEDDSASKNNTTTLVLERFGFARQTVSPSNVLHIKNVSPVRVEATHVTCFNQREIV